STAPALQHDQQQQRDQPEQQEEQVARQQLPPPVEQLAEQQHQGKAQPGVDHLGPAAAYAQPDHQSRQNEAQRLVEGFHPAHRPVQVAAPPPVAEDQDRPEQVQQADHPIAGGETDPSRLIDELRQ